MNYTNAYVCVSSNSYVFITFNAKYDRRTYMDHTEISLFLIDKIIQV